jgi:signal transduction histidine kinase
VWRDWLVVGVFVPVAVLEGLLRDDLPYRAVSVAVTVGLIPTLLWRRTRPLLMVVIAFVVPLVATLLTNGHEPEMVSAVVFILLPYALVRWGSGREVILGLAVVFGSVAFSFATGDVTLGDTVGGSAFLTAALALGAALRYRASARQRLLAQVQLIERERLARDLHDTVAHHVSAIAVRAQAGLATAAVDPDAAVDALRVIEAEASRTLAEMRTMVRVLRRGTPPEDADLAPGPRLADLHDLAGLDRDRGDGPTVDVEIDGDVADVPPSVGAAIYRLAQESVTNARRHARHATRIQVRVAADDTTVRLRVSDDGDGGAAAAASPGYGLIGMAERASLLGGTCEAGPDPGRGWTVTAVLPRAGWAT